MKCILVLFIVLLYGCANKIDGGIKILEKDENSITFEIYCPCSLDNANCDDSIQDYYIDECVFYIINSIDDKDEELIWLKYAATHGQYWGEAVYGMKYIGSDGDLEDYIPWLKLSARRGVLSSVAQYSLYLLNSAENEQRANDALCWLNKSYLFGVGWVISPKLYNIAYNAALKLKVDALLHAKIHDSNLDFTDDYMDDENELLNYDITHLAKDLIIRKQSIEKPNPEYEQLLKECE